MLPDERNQLEELTESGETAARKVIKARALLLCDQSEPGPGWTDAEVIEATGNQALYPGTAAPALLRSRAPRSTGSQKATEAFSGEKLTGQVEARLTQLACSEPPKGCARWTLHLLADELVRLEVVDSMSHESVRQMLKKTNLNLG